MELSVVKKPVVYKIIMIGDQGVGKSCVMLKFSNNEFSVNYISTLGIDFCFKNMEINGKPITMKIWDTAGQEMYRAISTAYFRGVHGAIIVYDITDKKSFKNVNYWIDNLKKENDKASVIIIGNKTDLEKERVVDYMDGVDLATKNQLMFYETSAKTGKNIEETFTKLAEIILEKVSKMEPNEEEFSQRNDTRKLSSNDNNRSSFKRKCRSC